MPSVSKATLGRIAVAVVLVVAALSFPSLAPNPYILSAGIVVLNYAVLSTSWNFVGGFTGYISLGHGALAGLGGYGTGLLVVKAGLPSFVALILAALLVAALAVPIGYAALRVRGASFVIVSIALVLIMLLVFQSWASFTGGSRGLVVPRPFPGMLRPEHHRVFFFLFAGLLGLALLAWWLIDRSRFGLGLKAIREDEDKAESLGTPTFAYKLVVFVVSAGFTALAGGLYALWFGDLDPVFQFSILTGSYMVLMALLGGVRNLYGPLLGALVVGIALEYFKVEFGNTPLHLVATGLLLGLVVMFMPDGVLPAVGALVNRFRPQQSSIREMTAAELRDERTATVPAPRAGSDPDAVTTSVGQPATLAGRDSASDSASGGAAAGGMAGSAGAGSASDSASGGAAAGGPAAPSGGGSASDSASGSAGTTSAGAAAGAGAARTTGSTAKEDRT